VFAQGASCQACGAEVAAGSRFCPQCGTRLDAGATATAVAPLPPDETGPVPVATARVEPDLFGITPPTALLVLGAGALVVAVVLFAVGEVLAGSILLLGAIVMLVGFAGVAARKPDTRLARASVSALVAARARAGFAATALTTRSGARRRASLLRVELDALGGERSARLSELGAAVYGGDKKATQSLGTELKRLDEAIAAKEDEMALVTAEMEESIARARLETQPTEMVQAPEPYPPPDEGDFPERPEIPEPYPPPGEGDLPEPGGPREPPEREIPA
jgi:hypothetical protein